MALEIFRLMGSIFIDNDKANESIAKTDEKAQAVGKTFFSGVGKAAKWGAGIVAGAGAGMVALSGVAKKRQILPIISIKCLKKSVYLGQLTKN